MLLVRRRESLSDDLKQSLIDSLPVHGLPQKLEAAAAKSEERWQAKRSCRPAFSIAQHVEQLTDAPAGLSIRWRSM